MSFLLDTGEAPSSVSKMKPEALSRLATALKVADTSKDRIRDYIKAKLVLTGGELDLGNGDKFAITTQKRRILLTQKALPVLAKYVTAKDIAKATTLTLGTLLTAATARVKGPMKAVLRREVEQALEKAGAVVTVTQDQMRTVFHGDKKWPTKKKTPKGKK